MQEKAEIKRILYVEGNPDGTVGGSYFLMLDLIQGLDRSRFKPIAIFRFDNFVAERLREAGVEVHIFPLRKPLVFSPSWLNTLLAPIKKLVNFVGGFVLPVFAYARFLREHKIDLINLNNSITRNHPWMVAARLAHTPCITHEMGINPEYSPFSQRLGRRLDAIICLSYAIRDAMESRGVDLTNATVIHCGIDAKRYTMIESPDALREKHNIPAGAPIVGVVGNIRIWKGQETIVKAMGILVQQFPDLRCVLAGGHTDNDIPYLTKLQSICADLGIADRVIFAGFQKNAIDYMRLMDVVAHTSIHPEPFGIVTLEAMLLGKPLVSTTIGGPAEVVVNGVSGLLVDPGKPELLADAIAKLLADPAAAAEMGRRGLERSETEFSLEKNLARTVEVYDSVLFGQGINQGKATNAQLH